MSRKDFSPYSLELSRPRSWGCSLPDRWKALRLPGLVAIALGVGLSSPGLAQKGAANSTVIELAASDELPDAPGVGPISQVAVSPSSPEQGSASISATVVDGAGALVAGARVTLTDQAGAAVRVLQSGSDGTFAFADLAAGTYRVTITAEGMVPFVSQEIQLAAGSRRELPQIILPIATANVDVRVTVSLQELATEQVHTELQQRVLGIFPSFYMSYIWDAAPLNAKQKFELALRTVSDPVTFLVAGAVAGVQQAADTFPGYGQGAEGYGKRYGAAYTEEVTARVLASAVLASILHQDPRYFYRGSGSIKTRTWYAISWAFACRGDSGHRQFNYSSIMGSFAAAGLSNLYHPEADRGAGLTIRNGIIDIAGSAGDNLFREFLFRKLTPKVPDYAKGKP